MEDILTKTKLPIFIWGSGEVGLLVYEKIMSYGVTPTGFVTDTSDVTMGGFCKEDVVSRYKDYMIVRGFLGSFYLPDEEIKRIWPGCSVVATVSDIYEPRYVEAMGNEYYEQNRNRFEEVRKSFADELSIKSYDGFITSKIKKSNEAILPCVVPIQYFFENSPWKYDEDDVLVDCGAFNGDSIADFIKLRGNKYKEVVAFEPDGSNYKVLMERLEKEKIKNVETHNVGTYKEKAVLSFDISSNMETRIDKNGVSKLEVNSIDNVCDKKRVSIIKMDIEGAEMDALEGAKKTIAQHKPILMLSAYHKRDDLFHIWNYVNSLYNGYRWFFRCHKPIPIDAVLYAVPEGRIK